MRKSGGEWLLLTLLLVGTALALDWSDWTWRLDNLAYDGLLRLSAQPAAKDVVILAIDERSLRALGRWPWPRRLHAELIDKLTAAGARSIGLDIIFAEPDFQDLEGDTLLAAAIRRNGRVVLPVLPEQSGEFGRLQETLPLPTLAAEAAGLGHIDLEMGADGIVRYSFLAGGMGGPRWPHFSTVLLKAASSEADIHQPGTASDNSLAWVRTGRVGIPFDAPGRYRRYSYIDVLRGTVGSAQLSDRILIVGATATGLGQTMSTPRSGQRQTMDSVEILANMLEAQRAGTLIRSLPLGWQLALSAAIALLPMLFFPRLQTNRLFALTALLLLIPIGVSVSLLWGARVWFEPVVASIVVLFSFPLWSWRLLRDLARSLASERSRARLTLQALTEAVVIADQQGRIRYLNPAAVALTGWAKTQAKDRYCGEVLSAVDEENGTAIDELYCSPESDMVGRLPSYWCLTDRRGVERRVRGTVVPLVTDQSRSGYAITFADVTEERNLADQIAHQATHDTLTGLPNRMLLYDRLEQCIVRADRSRSSIALLFADLDDFKRINDSLGHAVGDLLLQDVANRLREQVREADTVARLGGDEFIIVIDQLAHEHAAEPIARKLVASFNHPFLVQGQETIVGISIGICFYPRNGNDLDSLLRQADIAMYHAKGAGGNNYQLFELEMDASARDRFILENDLHQALRLEQFRLEYQPIIELASGRIVGAEALVSWYHPERGEIPPGEFIAIAERTGLIVPLGRWVLRTACAALVRWRANGNHSLRIAVNLSPRQIVEPGFPGEVMTVLRENGLPADFLEFEVTENLLMPEGRNAVEVLEGLSTLGMQLAIDDFGIGYSSLSYLNRFSINRLKIDRSFVHDIEEDSEHAAIVRAIVALAGSLHLKITAEGVETQAQAEHLMTLGPMEAQGFLFHAKMAEAEFCGLLEQQTDPTDAR